jgi:hypothetical protein
MPATAIHPDLDKTSATSPLSAPAKPAFKITTAVVTEILEDSFVVFDSQTHVAHRAASCMTIPQLGDTTMIATNDEQTWIMAVLVTAGVRDIVLQSPQLRLSSQNALMNFEQLHTASHQWSATHGVINLTSSKVQATVSVVEWIGSYLTMMADLLFSKSRRSIKEVSEIESVQCANFDLQVDKVMSLSTQTGVITGHGVMKIDAAQIHLG